MNTKKNILTISKVLLLVISGVILIGSILFGPLFSNYPGVDAMIPISFISGIIFVVTLIVILIMRYFLEPTANGKKADLIIMIFLIYTFVSVIARFTIEQLVANWYEGSTKYILIGINLISGILVILLGLSIRNKTSKIFGIILASLYAIFIIYSNYDWMIK